MDSSQRNEQGNILPQPSTTESVPSMEDQNSHPDSFESKGTCLGESDNPQVRRSLAGDAIKIITTLDNAAIDLKERADAFLFGFDNRKKR